MGQASIPVLNRTGCYMYWLSSWDDLHSFSKRFNEDLFLRSFFENMFHRKVSTHFLYWSNGNWTDKYKMFCNKYKFYFRHHVSFKQIPKFLRRFYKIPYYWSKIRIVRFQKWLIVYCNLFSTNKKKSFYMYKRFNIYKNLVLLNRSILKRSFFNDSLSVFD